jgi:hypothetical protein
MHQVSGDPGESIERLAAFLKAQGVAVVYTEKIAPALGCSYGGRIVLLPGQSKAKEFSTWLTRRRTRCSISRAWHRHH